MRKVAGYSVYKFGGAGGVGIIPRASVSARFGLYKGGEGSLTGTLGLPATKGNSSTHGDINGEDDRYEWSLPPALQRIDDYYDASSERTATVSGTWVIVADESQKNAEVKLPKMFFGSFSTNSSGSLNREILPDTINLRISSLECTVNTPTTINFGNVMRDSRPNAELARTSVPLTTSCGQDTNNINANINLQFRALTELYEGDASRLALKQGGGYITGEIDNRVTGSGACASSSGVNFNNEPIKLGKISSTASSAEFKNQLTWRLCSGGSSLPTGAVDTAAELLVTFN